MSHGIPFREYEFVKRHSEELDLLEKLWRVRLTPDQAESVIDHVVRRRGWRYVKLDPTGRKIDHGRYEFGGYWGVRIRVARQGTLAEVLAHELAHHGVGHLKGGRPRRSNGSYRWHGIDFVNVLDTTACEVADYLGERT